MKGELLELIPQKYLCPKCGKWHKYTWDQNLGYYDSSDYAIVLTVLVLLRFILLMIDAIGMKVISVIGVRLVNFPKLVNLGCK